MITAKPGHRSLSSGTYDSSKLSSDFCRGAHTTNKRSQKERGEKERRTVKLKGKQALWAGKPGESEGSTALNHFAERRAIHNAAARGCGGWSMLLVPELGRVRSRRISHSKFQDYREILPLNKQKQKKQTEGLASLYCQCWLPTVVPNHSFPSSEMASLSLDSHGTCCREP